MPCTKHSNNPLSWSNKTTVHLQSWDESQESSSNINRQVIQNISQPTIHPTILPTTHPSTQRFCINYKHHRGYINGNWLPPDSVPFDQRQLHSWIGVINLSMVVKLSETYHLLSWEKIPINVPKWINKMCWNNSTTTVMWTFITNTINTLHAQTGTCSQKSGAKKIALDIPIKIFISSKNTHSDQTRRVEAVETSLLLPWLRPHPRYIRYW